MVGVNLTVYPRQTVVEHHSGKMRERALARIRHMGKHRLTKEARPYRYAIETTDKSAALPSLESMCKAKSVEFTVPSHKIFRHPVDTQPWIYFTVNLKRQANLVWYFNAEAQRRGETQRILEIINHSFKSIDNPVCAEIDNDSQP